MTEKTKSDQIKEKLEKALLRELGQDEVNAQVLGKAIDFLKQFPPTDPNETDAGTAGLRVPQKGVLEGFSKQLQ